MLDNQFEIIDEKKNRGFMLLVALACFRFSRDDSKIEYADVDCITVIYFSEKKD